MTTEPLAESGQPPVDAAVAAPQMEDATAIWNDMETQETDTPPEGREIPEPAPTESPAAPAAEPTPEHLSDEARKEFDRILKEKETIEQRMRSDEGRRSAHARRLDELLRTARPQEPAKREDVREALKTLPGEYPELVKPLSDLAEKIESRLDRYDAAEASRIQHQNEELRGIVVQQTATLSQIHPDYKPFLAANAKAFQAWVEDQPRKVREAAYRNGNVIVDAMEASEVIEAFKTHLGLIAPPPQQTPPAPDTRRKRQMEATAAPQRGGRQPTVSGIPEDGDPKAIWDAFEAAESSK